MIAGNVTNILEEARIALSEGRSIYADKLNRRLHALAEAQDETAKIFFVTLLQADNASWRLESLRNLGFHYDLGGEPSLIERIRDLLLKDPDVDVRMAAASILGIQSAWPDRTLYEAMTTDINHFVNEAAFESLLRLSGMSYRECQIVMKQVETGALRVSAESLDSLLGSKFTDLLQDS
jgi:hypothetical protein